MSPIRGVLTLPLLAGCLPSGLQTKVDDLEARLVAAEQGIAALNLQLTGSASADNRLAAAEQGVAEVEMRLSAVESATDILDADVVALLAADSEEYLIANTTLSVPATYPSLSDALAWLGDKTLAPGVIVTIAIAPGTYTFTDSVKIDHPNGDRIYIVGDLNNPAGVRLEFTGTHGFEISNSRALGLLGGVAVVGDGTPATNGVSVTNNATLIVGEGVIVEGFGGAGFEAFRGGFIYAEGTTATNNLVGYSAVLGGIIDADLSFALNNESEGYFAEYGGALSLVGVLSEDNGANGVFLGYGSNAEAPSAISRENGIYGFYIQASSLYMDFATASDNGSDGVRAHFASWVHMFNATVESNGGNGLETAFGSQAIARDAVIQNNVLPSTEPATTALAFDGSYIYP